MDWIILSFVIIGMALFLSFRIAMVHPSVNSIEFNPPTIVTQRVNQMPEAKQQVVIELAKQFNYSVDKLSTNVTIIYPKFSVNKSASSS